jgi:hypothetical protein
VACRAAQSFEQAHLYSHLTRPSRFQSRSQDLELRLQKPQRVTVRFCCASQYTYRQARVGCATNVMPSTRATPR